MKGISGISFLLKRLVPKSGARYVQQIKPASIFTRELAKPRFATDTFHSTRSKLITPEGVRELFVDGNINGDEIRRQMLRMKVRLFMRSFKNFKIMQNFKLLLHSVDLSNKLTPQDCKEVADFMNLFDGKYANIWRGYSSTDIIPNIEKLALFTRSIKRIDKLNFYKNLDEKTWENCIDGIINRPREVIPSLMEYKFDSNDINTALSSGRAGERVLNKINRIKKFLDTQFLKNDITVYRGEGGLGIFGNVEGVDGKKRDVLEMLKSITERAEQGLCTQEEINNFIKQNLVRQRVIQERFMSTALEPEAIKNYAKKVYWEIFMPAKSKASMIEAYNVERQSEAEVLIQRISKLFIRDAEYDNVNKRWHIKARLEQSHLEK